MSLIYSFSPLSVLLNNVQFDKGSMIFLLATDSGVVRVFGKLSTDVKELSVIKSSRVLIALITDCFVGK